MGGGGVVRRSQGKLPGAFRIGTDGEMPKSKNVFEVHRKVVSCRMEGIPYFGGCRVTRALDEADLVVLSVSLALRYPVVDSKFT